MNRLGDTSAFVIPAGQLLLTRRGKTRMYTVGIVFLNSIQCPFNCDACFAMGAEHCRPYIAVAGASDGILHYTGMDKTCLDTSSWEFIRDSVVPDVHARRT